MNRFLHSISSSVVFNICTCISFPFKLNLSLISFFLSFFLFSFFRLWSIIQSLVSFFPPFPFHV